MQIARESVFITSIRSFFRWFFAVFGLFFGIIGASMLYSMLGGAAKAYEEKTEFSILPDLKGEHAMLSTSSPAILQINIVGEIGGPGGVNSDDLKNILLDSRSGLLAGGRVKGILLNFNTPGGESANSDTMYRMMKAYKEKFQVPVFAYVDGLCASGGMFIAASADQIFASPPSIVGSIGVTMIPLFNVSGAMEKFGVASMTISAGTDKDMMNPFRAWKPDEGESLKEIVDFLYGQFVDVMTQNRPKIDKNKLIHEYGAKIFDVVKAQEIGYIDTANASYDQTVLALLTAAKIDPEKPYQMVELKPKKNWLSTLANNQSPLFTGKIEHHLSLPGTSQKPFAYLYQPGQSPQ